METNSSYYTDLISRYFFGEATPREILELSNWVKSDPANASIFTAYRETWQTIEHSGIGSSVDLDGEWDLLKARILVGSEQLAVGRGLLAAGSKLSVTMSWALRIAAVFLLVAIPAFLLYRSFNFPAEKQFSALAGTSEQILPDGTVVTLNAGALLTCPSRFEGSFRKVTLQGEAWFEVAHDKSKPFIIASGNTRIRVVGTSFSVNTKTLKNTKEIVLSEGIVRVYFEDMPQTSILLLPGEKGEVNSGNDAIVKSANEDVNFLAWKTKRLVFSNTPLNEVAALLTKVYQTSIRLSGEGLNDCRITATFDRQSLESVLNVLKATLNLQVRNSGTGIELSGNGCNQGQ